jgi:hypothetical protein
LLAVDRARRRPRARSAPYGAESPIPGSVPVSPPVQTPGTRRGRQHARGIPVSSRRSGLCNKSRLNSPMFVVRSRRGAVSAIGSGRSTCFPSKVFDARNPTCAYGKRSKRFEVERVMKGGGEKFILASASAGTSKDAWRTTGTESLADESSRAGGRFRANSLRAVVVLRLDAAGFEPKFCDAPMPEQVVLSRLPGHARPSSSTWHPVRAGRRAPGRSRVAARPPARRCRTSNRLAVEGGRYKLHGQRRLNAPHSGMRRLAEVDRCSRARARRSMRITGVLPTIELAAVRVSVHRAWRETWQNPRARSVQGAPR